MRANKNPYGRQLSNKKLLNEARLPLGGSLRNAVEFLNIVCRGEKWKIFAIRLLIKNFESLKDVGISVPNGWCVKSYIA